MVRPGLFSSTTAARKGCQLLDELFEIFERDRDGRNERGQERGGIRGFLGRLFGGDDDDGDEDRPRRGRNQAGESAADTERTRRERDRAGSWDD